MPLKSALAFPQMQNSSETLDSYSDDYDIAPRSGTIWWLGRKGSLTRQLRFTDAGAKNPETPEALLCFHWKTTCSHSSVSGSLLSSKFHSRFKYKPLRSETFFLNNSKMDVLFGTGTKTDMEGLHTDHRLCVYLSGFDLWNPPRKCGEVGAL